MNRGQQPVRRVDPPRYPSRPKPPASPRTLVAVDIIWADDYDDPESAAC
jgi:hypothetical protein